MKIEIEDATIAKEIAGQTIRELENSLSRDDFRGLWYNEAIDLATRASVAKVVEKNEERICKAVVKLIADKVSKNITLAAIIAAIEKEKKK